MVLGLALAAAVAVGLALGGSLSALSELRLRAPWLIIAAIAVQVAAFPSAWVPWHTADAVATWLWVASYALLITAMVLNFQIRGMEAVVVGMGFNLTAIVVNGGHMPALPEAAARAGLTTGVQLNSETMAHPHLALLVDRFAAPHWMPMANVFSIGDIMLALGAFAIVLPAMKVGLPALRRSRAA